MRALMLFSLILLINSCKTKVDQVNPSDVLVKKETKAENSNCPASGICNIELFKGKTIELKEDGTGALYIELVESSNIVVKYTYSEKGPEGTVDGDYAETIHFEIPAGTTSLGLSDAQLEDANVVFGKHCFCRGEAGYYPVRNGNLKVTMMNELMSFDLSFKMDHPSHKISKISNSTSL